MRIKTFNLQLFAVKGPELSVYDQYSLSADDQKVMLDIKNRTLADPTNVTQYHQLAEDIRSKYNYSGGQDGFQYVKLDNKTNQGIPTIPTTEEYKSDYSDLINTSLNSVLNKQFSYNSDTDASYQAFVKKATRLGDEAFANNIGGLSASTGGRLNSWAATAASTARNDFAMQAAEAVGTFEDKAYSRFKDERTQEIDMIGLLVDLDERDYSRYKDKIDATLDNYQLELDQYKISIDDRKSKMDEAAERTKMQGYVSNADAVLLGVPPGTLSYEAMNKISDMNDWIIKQEKQLEFDQKALEQEFAFESKIAAMKDTYKTSSSGSSSGGSSKGGNTDPAYDGDPSNDERTKAEATKRDSEIADFKKYVESDTFRKLGPFAKKTYFNDLIDKILDDNAHGILADWVADAILDEITSTKDYTDVMSMKDPAKTGMYEMIGIK